MLTIARYQRNHVYLIYQRKMVMHMLSFNIDDSLELRIMDSNDAEAAIMEIEQSRDYLARWLPWVELTHTADDYRNFIRFTRDEFANESSYHFGIFDDGCFIGGFSINKFNRNDNKVELGYWLGKRHQKQGIITRTVEAVTDFLFKKWDVHRIEIHVATLNEASKKVPERLGFEIDGVMRESMRHNGKYFDMVIYSKLNPLHKSKMHR